MVVHLRNYIRPECFIPDLAEKSREAALRRIVHEVAERGLVKDERGVLEKLLERENIQSTAVGNGFAIPHCFADEIPGLIIIVVRCPDGLEFDSFDGKPTRILFLLMGNRQEYSLHLKVLARIAWLIKSTALTGKLVSSTSVQDIVRAIDEEEAKTPS